MSAAAATAVEVIGSRSSSSSTNSGGSSLESTTAYQHHHLHHLHLHHHHAHQGFMAPSPQPVVAPQLSRYESQKRRDWITFGQYLKNHRPPLTLSRCSGAHVLEFLRYLDQFGKTKVHGSSCPFYGHPHPPAPCPCPLKQAWGSLDALIGRLRAAYEENGGLPETNPFGARAVRLYLREVRDTQAKARGIAYEKKKRKKPAPPQVVQQQQQHEEQQGHHGNFISGYGGAAAGGGGSVQQPNGAMQLGGGSSSGVRGLMMPLSVLNC